MALAFFGGISDEAIHALIEDQYRKHKPVERLLGQPGLLEPSPDLPPVHAAVLNEDLSKLKFLLADEATNVNWRHRSVTPLHLAACSSDPELVVELLKNPDINVNAQTGRSRLTPLMLAVYFNLDDRDDNVRAEIVDLLAEDPRCKLGTADRDKFTALTYAVNIGFLEAVENLTRAGRAKQYNTADLLADAFLARQIGENELAAVLWNATSTAQRAELKGKSGDQKDDSARQERTEAPNVLLRTMKKLMRGRKEDSSSDEETRDPIQDAHGNVLEINMMVRIHSSVDYIEELQAGHGGFSSDMRDMAGQLGIVRHFDKDKDVYVEGFVASENATKIKCFYRKLLTIVPKETADREYPDEDGKTMSQGTVVRVPADKSKVVEAQARFGGWKDTMEAHLGKLGTLQFFTENGDALVEVNGTAAYYRPEVLQKITEVICGDGSRAKAGDRVRIIASEDKFKELQTPQFGDWDDRLANFAGCEVLIRKIRCNASKAYDAPPACIFQVEVVKNGSKFGINPQAVVGLGQAA